jgi:energy-converting hydrogenase A subunit M
MKKVLIAAVASALATAAVVAATGIAGSGDTKKKTSPPPTMSQAFKDMQKQRDDHLSKVAKRLDISTEKLKDALDKVVKADLAEAVDAGRLTDAQRDVILACQDAPLTCDRSNLPAFGGRRFHPGKRSEGRAKGQDFLADLAKELDIDVAKVRAAFKAERPKFRRGGRGGFGPGGPPGFRGGPGGGPDGPRGFHHGPPGGGPPGGGGPGAPGSFQAPAGAPVEPA